MKQLAYILMVVLCLAAASAAGKKDGGVSKKDHEAAEQEYKHAVEMQKAGQLDDAVAANRAKLFGPAAHIRKLPRMFDLAERRRAKAE